MNAPAEKSKPRHRRFSIPFLQGVLPIQRADIAREIVAGVTLAALAIPEVMGYTKIAGTPIITGLYTILVPMAVFALLGSSRHLVVGADSATAAIFAAGLAAVTTIGSPDYLSLCEVIAIMAGGFLIAARLLRLGFIANFLSRTVLVGFLTGVGIQVACGQIAGVLGIQSGGKGPIKQLAHVVKEFGTLNLATVAISTAVLVVIVAGGKLVPKIPWSLIAVIGAIAASAVFDLRTHGVETIGDVPGGLPHFGLPRLPKGDFVKLLGTAASVFIVVLAQSAATSRAYAAKFDDDFDEDMDLVGLGLANVSAGLFGTFAVNGSPTKTAMVDSAGGKSQLAQLTTTVIVLGVLLFLTKPLAYMPGAVLAAVVLLIGIRLVDVKGMRTIYRLRPVEFWVALATAATVVFVGVEQGIYLAVVLSIIAHLRHSYSPYDRLMVATPSGVWTGKPLTDGAQAAPGLLVYRFGASLYYANAGRFQEEVTGLVKEAPEPVKWFCVAAATIADIDCTGSDMLREVITNFRKRDVEVVLCDVHSAVLKELARDGLLDLIGKEHVFGTANDVCTAYQAAAAE